MDEREAKSVIESILFISGEPITVDSLRKIIELEKSVVEACVKELITDYSVRNSGLLIIEVAGGVQMVTNPASAPYIKKLISTAVPTRLSQPALETLAIIAYKQPIIKAEIEAIRGVNSDGVVKTLLERRLIKILGRKEVPGRPLLLGTTKDFLQYFGLKDLSELPTLKELQEVDVPELFASEGEVKDEQQAVEGSISEAEASESASFEQENKDNSEEIHSPEQHSSDMPEEPDQKEVMAGEGQEDDSDKSD